jgi:hypothetical protein
LAARRLESGIRSTSWCNFSRVLTITYLSAEAPYAL